MPTGRTATGAWKKIRRREIERALEAEQYHCRFCGVPMDFEFHNRPNSAQVDHIIPYRLGGTDDSSNLQILCRRCNQSKGARHAPKGYTASYEHKPLKTSRPR